jgi:hypothetical protein
MLSLAKMTQRNNIGVFVLVLVILIGGTWATVKITTDYLLYQMATSVARNWAQYLTENATDLEQIAAGEQPSNASIRSSLSLRNFQSRGIFAVYIGSRQNRACRRVGIQRRRGTLDQKRPADDRCAAIPFSRLATFFCAGIRSRRRQWAADRRRCDLR